MARRTLALVLLVAGCGAAAPEVPPRAAGDACNAVARGGLVGQDATALERVLILGPVRVIRPGEPVSEELMSQRINFDITADERIARVWCG